MDRVGDRRPGLQMSIEVLDPPTNPEGRKTRAEQYATAGPVIAAIPVVCEAPPGIYELPTLLPWHPFLGRALRPERFPHSVLLEAPMTSDS